MTDRDDELMAVDQVPGQQASQSVGGDDTG